MHVSVHEDGALVVMRVDPARCASEGVIDRALGAGVAELDPQISDEPHEEPALLRSGRQATVGRRAPHLLGRRGKDLVPLLDRQGQLVERGTQPFEEERSDRLVGAKELHTALARSQSEHRDLARGRLERARDDQLEHGRCAVFEDRIGNKRFRRVVVAPADRNRPLPLEARDEIVEISEPSFGADCERLAPDNFGKIDHQKVSAAALNAVTLTMISDASYSDAPRVMVNVGIVPPKTCSDSWSSSAPGSTSTSGCTNTVESTMSAVTQPNSANSVAT